MAKAIRRATICECGGDTYEKSVMFVDGEMVDSWSCWNCGAEGRRQTRQARTDVMTRSQKQVIEQIRYEATDAHNEFNRYELVNFTTELTEGGYVIVRGERHYEGNENSLNNSSFQLFVGRKGKVKGNIFPSLGSIEKVDSKSLFKLHIY
jgi:hypothetical protein